MKNILIIILCIFPAIPALYSQEIREIGSEELEIMLNQNDDKLHIINFWATWCSPCVTELPYFEKALSEFPADKVNFHFISLDFKSSVETTLIPFLKDRKMTPYVVLMTDTNYDKWIRKVDESWKGNIPASLFYKKSEDFRLFHPGVIEYEELVEIINKYI